MGTQKTETGDQCPTFAICSAYHCFSCDKCPHADKDHSQDECDEREYVQIPHGLIDSEEFHGLSCKAVALLMYFVSMYRGPQTRPIICSDSIAAEYIKCGRKTVKKFFAELVDAGMIEGAGSVDGEPTWRMTWLPFSDSAPSNLWLSDEPQDEQ